MPFQCAVGLAPAGWCSLPQLRPQSDQCAGVLAGNADAAHIAGQASERSYDAHTDAEISTPRDDTFLLLVVGRYLIAAISSSRY
ncbi:hypothetical protein ACU4GI_12335 [Cupriavidus basilensis]